VYSRRMVDQVAEIMRSRAKDELARRRGDFKPVLPIALSPEQEAFIKDPSVRKVGRCGRRAGKSTTMLVYFVLTMLNKANAKCLYLALTRDQAKAIAWEPMIALLRAAGIRHTAAKSELKITLHNGSFLRLFGADSDKAKNRLLGQPWDLVCADECAYVNDVDELITRVIEPSLMDYGGTICLTSSPPPAFQGLFFEADQGTLKKHWSQHHWTIKENPFFAGRADKLLADVIETKFGGNPNHPTYRREYLGEWVANSSDRIYPVDTRNLIETVPAIAPGVASWNVLGFDLGLRDPNAIVALQARDDSRDVVELESWGQEGMTVDQLAGVLNSFVQKYSPIAIIADTGGYGAGIVNELRNRYSINIVAADKRDKGFYQEIVKADMLSGYTKFLKGSGTVEEMQLLVRDAKTGQEDARCANHKCDAYLYGYRFIYNRHLKNFEKPKTYDDMMIAQLQRVHDPRKQDEDPWGDTSNDF
jgi:hypothetical protein